MHVISAAAVYEAGVYQPDQALVIDQGRIVAVQNVADVDPALPRTHYPHGVLTPGFVNTHVHSFQSLLKGIADDADFFTWRKEALYRFSPLMTADDIYIGALFAFAETLKAGSTAVCDFFYLHDGANEHAHQVIRAAKALGIRVVLARTMYDWDGAPPRYRESVSQAVENTAQLYQAYQADPMVGVLPAPHSFHGASWAMIEAGEGLSKDWGVPWHMHIAEGQYEREQVTRDYGQAPIATLAKRGLLSERTVGIHCVWVDAAEIQQMAQAEAMVSYNPSSNLFLGDGLTPIRELHQAGVTMGLGTDGGCSNNRASIVDEMRTCSVLQKVRFHDSTVSQAEDVFQMATVNGGKVLGLPVGQLKAGYDADFNVISLEDLSMQPPGYFGKHVVYSMQPSAMEATYVAGQQVTKRGQLLQIDEAQLVADIQAVMARLKKQA
jgi:5-methylthioadenosine/S-adenosylhomocysteine deaminase